MVPRSSKFMLLIGLALLLGSCLAIRCSKDPESLLAWIPLRCPLKFLTGMACPTCGLGHALIYLVRGELETSLAYHPLGIPFVFFVCWLVYWETRVKKRGHPRFW